MIRKKILISDKVHPLLVDGLRSEGVNVDYHPKMPYADVKDIIGNYQGVIVNSKIICDASFIDQASHLDFIGRLGSGLDIIDLPYAAQQGIKVISSPEGNANAVAEHAMGMLLSLMHNLGNSHDDVRNMAWNREPNRGEELKGKTIGIIGFGHTGPAFAKKLSSFEVTILAYDKYKKGLNVDAPDVEEVSLTALKERSDVISIHLPLTQETNGWINNKWLESCKSQSIFINTSRGGIVNSPDLLSHLESGHLKGVCLDVLENEVPSSWTGGLKQTYLSLLDRKDVLITPHIAGWTHKSLALIASVLLRKISSFYKK
jgi:D-3-phosphoglycerate dehydrogenase